MPRRILEGNVVSSKNDKTITVLVERRYMHPVYKKYIKSSGKYTAHDENNQFKEGDRVSIIECRPLSKRKRWTVITADEAAKIAKTSSGDEKKIGKDKGQAADSKKVAASAKNKKVDGKATKKAAEGKGKAAAKKSTAKKKDA